MDTNLDTSAKNLDTFWILLGAFSDTWPPLHVATKGQIHGCGRVGKGVQPRSALQSPNPADKHSQKILETLVFPLFNSITTNGRTDGRTDGGTEGRRDGRTDGRTDGWTDGRTDGRTDGQSLPQSCVSLMEKKLRKQGREKEG